MKIGLITQVRMTSTRLPGKVLKKIAGRAMLEYHILRLLVLGVPIVVATTTNSEDDEVIELCSQMNIPTYRGSESDVLSRYYGCAVENDFSSIIRVTSDCPLIDGEVIKKAIEEYKCNFSEDLYFSNCLERTFPRGMDFEIFSFRLLEEAFNNAKTTVQREHVTPYIHYNISGKTLLKNFKRIRNDSQYRLTVDTEEDFNLIQILIEKYKCHEKNVDEIIEVLENNPELASINSHIEQKKVLDFIENPGITGHNLAVDGGWTAC